jgi:hypothetical protein
MELISQEGSSAMPCVRSQGALVLEQDLPFQPGFLKPSLQYVGALELPLDSTNEVRLGTNEFSECSVQPYKLSKIITKVIQTGNQEAV